MLRMHRHVTVVSHLQPIIVLWANAALQQHVQHRSVVSQSSWVCEFASNRQHVVDSDVRDGGGHSPVLVLYCMH